MSMVSSSSNVAVAAEHVAAKLAESDDASLQPLAVAGVRQDASGGPLERRKEEAVHLTSAEKGETPASSNGTSNGGVPAQGGVDRPFDSFPAAAAATAAGPQQAAVPGELREAVAAAQRAFGGLGAAGTGGGEAGGAGVLTEEAAVGQKGPLLAGRVPDAYGGADPAAHCIDASEVVARAEPQ